MSKARGLLVALVTAGLMALAGCGGNPQVAVYIGEEQVPLSRVESVAKVLADTSPGAGVTASSFTPTVMQIFVQAELAARVAQAKGISVTEAERQSVYAQNQVYPLLLANPVSADFMKAYADTAVILGNEAAQAPYRELLAATPIRVNPRFGTWDAEQGGLVEGSSGSLSSLAPVKQG